MAKRWYYKDENGNKVPVPQYKIDADDYYTKAMSDSRYYDKSATDTLLGGKVSKTDITQSTGTSETAVMSQKAVSDALSTKVGKSDIVQSTGTSTTAVMSQKASTDSFIANTPSGDPMHNLYVEVGAIYNDTGKDIERVDQWGDTIIHKDGCWYLNGLGDLTNADMNRCWVYANCIYHGYNFNISGYRGHTTRTNIPYISKGIPPTGDVYKDLSICNWEMDTFAFNDITFKDVSLVTNTPLKLDAYSLYNSNTIKFYGWVLCESTHKLTFYRGNIIECIGLILVGSVYLNCPKLRADCIRQIIEAVRVTDNITITLHPEAYDRAIADAGVQAALANKTNVSLAKGE